MAIEPKLTELTYNDLAEKIVTAQLPCFEFDAFDGDFPKVRVRMSEMRYAIEAGDERFGRRCFYTVSRGKYELAARLEEMTGHYKRSIGGRFLTPLYRTSKISFHTKNKKAGVSTPTYHYLADKLIASLDRGASGNGNRISGSALLLQGKDERTNIYVSMMEEVLSGETGDRCQRRYEIVRKRRRNFVVFRRQGGDKIKRFLAQKECSQFAASGA